MEETLFEYGFRSVNGIVKKVYYLHEIPNISQKCDVWNILPIIYVRQATPFTDMTGKRAFVGDQYMTCHDTVYTIFYKNGAFCGGEDIDSCEPLGWSPINKEEMKGCDFLSKEAKIIGNIHDKK